MKALLQRVAQARVEIAGQTVGEIAQGLLVLVCAERGDSEVQADKLLAKILKLRIFGDEAGKMNRSVQNLDGQGACGGLLIVSQFTLAADASGGNRPSFTAAAAPDEGPSGELTGRLAADTSTGNRPGFTGAAPPDEGRRLYDYFVAQASAAHPQVATGQFAADMQVHLVNDGPVTIPLQIDPASGG